MKMNKIIMATLAAGAVLMLPSVMRASIIGSQHDFSTNSWANHNVCQTCHIPHDSLGATPAPLWNHTLSQQSYVTYSSPQFLDTVGISSAPQPDGPSLACLSCHDGTVAINSFVTVPFGAQTNPAVFVTGNAVVAEGGNDISHNHPISFVYDSTLANKDGTLVNPNTYQIGQVPPYTGSSNTNNAAAMVPPVPASWSGVSLSGKTVAQALLWKGTGGTEMECTSCHDPHKMVGSSPSSGIMVKISGNDVNGRGSLICRNCHLK